MKKHARVLLAILLLGAAGVAWADYFQPSHSCSKPYKPYEFTDQWELDRFRNAVEDYQRCLTDFVDEQNEAAMHHQNAASEAIEDWNRFVRYELQ